MPSIRPAAAISVPQSSSPVQNNPLVLTGKLQRNPKVSQTIRRMANDSRSGGASSATFLPCSNTNAQSWCFSYHTNLGKRLNIAQRPKGGVVRGTLVINVSGHAGPGTLHKFATTNTYNIRVSLPDGTVLERTGIPRNNPHSAEYATAIDIEFPYMSGVTTLEAWPEGSARTGGYVEGRKYSIHSHDSKFDVDAQKQKAQAYRDKHPSIRWGTSHEHSDVERARIAPSPWPYRER